MIRHQNFTRAEVIDIVPSFLSKFHARGTMAAQQQPWHMDGFWNKMQERMAGNEDDESLASQRSSLYGETLAQSRTRLSGSDMALELPRRHQSPVPQAGVSMKCCRHCADHMHRLFQTHHVVPGNVSHNKQWPTCAGKLSSRPAEHQDGLTSNGGPTSGASTMLTRAATPSRRTLNAPGNTEQPSLAPAACNMALVDATGHLSIGAQQAEHRLGLERNTSLLSQASSAAGMAVQADQRGPQHSSESRSRAGGLAAPGSSTCAKDMESDGPVAGSYAERAALMLENETPSVVLTDLLRPGALLCCHNCVDQSVHLPPPQPLRVRMRDGQVGALTPLRMLHLDE
jgi:hypothetical protein